MDLQRCWVHSKSSDEDLHSNLKTPRDLESWQTLLNAARIRKCSEVLELAANTSHDVVPNIYYHSQCRKIFTMKCLLEGILASRRKSEDVLSTQHPNCSIEATNCKRQPSTDSIGLLENNCVFCDKNSKYKKYSNTRETLIQCTDLRVDAKIREYAEKTCNTRLLGIVSSYEMVAAEAKYHPSCYRAAVAELKKLNKVVVDDDDAADDAYSKAFSDLVAHVQKLVDKPSVTSMVDLTRFYTNQLSFYGEVSVQESAKKNLKRKLENRFNEDLHFVQAENGRLLVYPDTLSMDEIVLENFKIKQELDRLKANRV